MNKTMTSLIFMILSISVFGQKTLVIYNNGWEWSYTKQESPRSDVKRIIKYNLENEVYPIEDYYLGPNDGGENVMGTKYFIKKLENIQGLTPELMILTGTVYYYNKYGIFKYQAYYEQGKEISRFGCVSGNCFDEYSTYEFKNGDIYLGYFKNGKMNGSGEIRTKEKQIFGEFQDNNLIRKTKPDYVFSNQLSESEVKKLFQKNYNIPNSNNNSKSNTNNTANKAEISEAITGFAVLGTIAYGIYSWLKKDNTSTSSSNSSSSSGNSTSSSYTSSSNSSNSSTPDYAPQSMNGVEIVETYTLGSLAVEHAALKIRNKNNYDVLVTIELKQKGAWQSCHIFKSSNYTDNSGYGYDNSEWETFKIKANSIRSVGLIGKDYGGRPTNVRIISAK